MDERTVTLRVSGSVTVPLSTIWGDQNSDGSYDDAPLSEIMRLIRFIGLRDPLKFIESIEELRDTVDVEVDLDGARDWILS